MCSSTLVYEMPLLNDFQVIMNYRRKSTEGWSIWQNIFDFSGGILSITQMILIAHNYRKLLNVL